MTTANAFGGIQPPDTPLSRLVHDGRIRARPMNRAYPREGHWVTDCPSCGATSTVWFHPGWDSFEAICGCWKGKGGVFAFYHLLRAQG